MYVRYYRISHKPHPFRKCILHPIIVYIYYYTIFLRKCQHQMRRKVKYLCNYRPQAVCGTQVKKRYLPKPPTVDSSRDGNNFLFFSIAFRDFGCYNETVEINFYIHPRGMRIDSMSKTEKPSSVQFMHRGRSFYIFSNISASFFAAAASSFIPSKTFSAVNFLRCCSASRVK